MNKERYITGRFARAALAGFILINSDSLGVASIGYQDNLRNHSQPDTVWQAPEKINAQNERIMVHERILQNRDNSPGDREIISFPPSRTSLRQLDGPDTTAEHSPRPEQRTADELMTTPSTSDMTLDPEISFYGPGFYGNRTACGFKLTTTLKGVANRTLPCGTNVTFVTLEGKELTVPVVDRGPYVSGRIFDLTGGACRILKHCWTGPIYYKVNEELP